MANCKANLNVQHLIVDVTSEEQVTNALFSLLRNDNDLIENEDEFREDTLELGFESEADRIVKEYIQENGVPNTIEDFENACEEISSNISDQEFFGECLLNLIQIDDNRISVVFATGGHDE